MRLRSFASVVVLASAIAVVALIVLGAGRRMASAPSLRASAVTPAFTGGQIVGLSEGASGWGGHTTGPRLNRLRATHARWLRDAFFWSIIEPRRNRFRFHYYDRYVLLAARRRMHIVAQLMGTPRWSGATPFSVPSNPVAYARYVRAVVRRYGPHGTFWHRHPRLRRFAISTYELWNEPYFDNGNAGRYAPGRYARLVKAAGSAAHAADPSVKVLLEAEMVSHHYRVWVWWTPALYHAVPGLNSYFDGVAVHDFGRYTKTLHRIVPGQPYPNYGHMRRIEDLHRQFMDHGAGDKPFWIMEIGWSTCRERSIDCVTDSQQRANLDTLFGDMRGRWSSWVQAAFIYRYRDGLQPSTVQDGYGLVNLNGKPKPAFSVFKANAARSAR